MTAGANKVPRDRQAVRLDAHKLQRWCQRCFELSGLSGADAAVAAAVVVRTSLRGSDTHGVHLLPTLVKKLAQGGANPAPEIRVLSEQPATALVDGDGGIGQLVMARATKLAIEKASSSGVAAVLVRNSTHFGAAGSFALMGAEAGMVTTISTNGALTINVPGSRGANLSSGTRAYGIPNDGPTIVLDISMAPSGAKIQIAENHGERIPVGWLVDAEGEPTTEPSEYLRGGARVAIGGHKGYGLALVNELISGALTGADLAWTQGSMDMLAGSRRLNVGHVAVALNVAAFCTLSDYLERVREVIDRVKASPRAPGADPIRIPGERAAELEQERAHSGLPVDAMDWQSLHDTAEVLGAADELHAARIPGHQEGL